MELVLSLFPGIDLLGRAFSAHGFCVVKGPDLIWDEDQRDFHAPAGKFDGIIAGPPCQNYSDANRFRDATKGDETLQLVLQAIAESQPEWFVIENVRNVPDVVVEGYHVQRLDLIDTECGGKQTRLRHIQFGSRCGDKIRPTRTKPARRVTPTLTCRPRSQHDRHSRRLELQSAPKLFLRNLTRTAKYAAIGNAVPWTMGTTLARAVAARSQPLPTDCPCQCGRSTPKGTAASAACRKRLQRRRQNHGRKLLGPVTAKEDA